MIKKSRQLDGFTLIEAIIYIALFGMLISGAVAVAYQISTSSSLTSRKAIVQDEGNFVLQKIRWALNSESSVTAAGSLLRIERSDGKQIDICLYNNKILLREGSAGTYACTDTDPSLYFYPITTNNVMVTDLQFEQINEIIMLKNMKIKTTNGTDAAVPFAMQHYLRQ